MARRNAFSSVASDSLDRIRDIVEQFSEGQVPLEARRRLVEELKFHEKTLQCAFTYRKKYGPPLGRADSDVYFAEKLGALVDFAQLAVEQTQGSGHTSHEISENISHYSYLVARLVAAGWTSRSRRPVSETTLREAGFEHREALQRLANR